MPCGQSAGSPPWPTRRRAASLQGGHDQRAPRRGHRVLEPLARLGRIQPGVRSDGAGARGGRRRQRHRARPQQHQPRCAAKTSATAHPSLKAAIAQGVTASDVWADAKTSQLMSVSYAPVRDDDRKVLGLTARRHPLNDGAPSAHRRADERTGPHSRHPGGARTSTSRPSPPRFPRRRSCRRSAQSPLKEAVARDGQSRPRRVHSRRSHRVLFWLPLHSAATATADAPCSFRSAPSSLIESINGLLWPVFAVTGLGILLVSSAVLPRQLPVAAGRRARGRSARDSQRQDRSPLRDRACRARRAGVPSQFAARTNSWACRKTTPTKRGVLRVPPQRAISPDALAVDERSVAARANVDVGAGGGAPLGVARYLLRPSFQRVHRRQALARRSHRPHHRGELLGRIRTSEGEMREKHGKPVRYRVETAAAKSMLIAVPLS